ncbi:hypothetical protein [Methylobacterium sp. WCS2018Hpa-22]|uniref:hypothetical protein n=1 Tax=Methylobacterium sp. WCS2018Hpa-22 TaxID=3073633 RepID=UPI00288ABD6A|nr:hypothetical protein [Methylobacterium sp. WCS2018Hpa-22]
MAIELHVTLDKRDLRRLAALKGEARLAGAKALTFTAKDAQTLLKAQVPSTFHLRNSWVPRGIRITPATPSSMSAEVGSIDKYMDRHVVGAGRAKPPERGLSIRGKHDGRGRVASGGLLIMPYGSIGQYPTHKVVRRKLSRVDGQKKKTFQILSSSGNQVLIVRRRSKKRKPLEVLGILRGAAVDIKQQWDMFGSVQGVVSARFGDHFERAISKI